MKIKVCFQKSPKDVPSQPPTKLFPHPLLLTPTFNTLFHPPHLARVCGTKNKARSQLNPFPPPAPSGGWALQSSFRGPTLLSCPLVPEGSSCGRASHALLPPTQVPSWLRTKLYMDVLPAAYSGGLGENYLGPEDTSRLSGSPTPARAPVPGRSVLCQPPGMSSRAAQSTEGWLNVSGFSPRCPQGYKKEYGPNPSRFNTIYVVETKEQV